MLVLVQAFAHALLDASVLVAPATLVLEHERRRPIVARRGTRSLFCS